MKKLLAAWVILGAVMSLPLAGAGQTRSQAAPHKSISATKKSATPAKKSVPKRSLLDPASLNQKAPEVFKAKFTTTKGDFVVQVTRAWAPLGADRFYNLVKNGFFTDAAFFRVISGFMVQFGISAKPAVTAAWQSATIQDDPVTQSNKRGYITFAKTGAPNSRSTQFFINFGDNSRLDATGFAPFGQVIEGMDVVDKLYSDYGEGAPGGNGPDQGRINAEGKSYLDKEFPKLDSIKSAVILGAPLAPKPTARPADSAKKKAA
jgi:peptidyl-prolyl cis-trans isomerase A (cyclophilin A)